MKATDSVPLATLHENGAKTDVPHAVLSDYYLDESHRRDFLGQIFDQTAHSYDWTERLIGFGSGPWYRHQALIRAGLESGMRIVDVGVGTGLVAREAIKIVGDPALVAGVDPSPGMLAQAHLPDGVQLLQGRGEKIPLPDSSADFLSMGFALRHLSSLSEAFDEFYRVMKPGARLCLLEITPPSNPFYRSLVKAYMTKVIPPIAWLKSRDAETRRIWQYYWETIEACVAPTVVEQALKNSKFDSVSRHVELGMFSEYTAVKPSSTPH